MAQVWIILKNGRGGRQVIEDNSAYEDELDALRRAGTSPLLSAMPLTLIPSSLSTPDGGSRPGTTG
jgi:hypothetical protein